MRPLVVVVVVVAVVVGKGNFEAQLRSSNTCTTCGVSTTQHKEKPSINKTYANGRTANLAPSMFIKSIAESITNHPVLDPKILIRLSLAVGSSAFDVEVVRKSLDVGANINSRTWGCAHFNVFKETLCSRYKVKRRSTTLFQPDEYWMEYVLRVHTPFREENDSLLLLLLEQGAGIDSTFATGATPLWVAVNQPNIHLSQRWIANGADVHFANDAGNTILHVAATGYNEEVIRSLLVKGTNVHLKNVVGYEGLEDPCDVGVRHEVVGILIQKGAGIEAESISGATPLLFGALYHAEARVLQTLELISLNPWNAFRDNSLLILIITVVQSISAHITEYAEAIKLQYTHLVTGLAHARDSSSLGRIVAKKEVMGGYVDGMEAGLRMCWTFRFHKC
ncbi:conserved hypothetical protein [Histoplasma capsulatum var. duboisii H88]|uniref:Uncharacterized protein n=2 Tax=Ajellomyces capsulatus TaxID=5037 RepID=F0UVH2_AJEC8|nr:conserved hypothetical protein [Histoplasma capsulatum H143]EGC49899.1 conserved hypothetical protein [Histoplasma capsulatum var. duboisii H88]